MSTIRELYDHAFLDCVARGKVNTDDLYNNNVVFETMKTIAKDKNQDLQQVYKSELLESIDDIRLHIKLVRLFNIPGIRYKIVDIVNSYMLYRTVTGDRHDNIYAGIINALNSDADIDRIDREIRDVIKAARSLNKIDNISPNMYAFLTLLSTCDL